jgi:hypothetical protein
MHGQFTWYELTTPDVDAAIAFYPRFTGWGTQAFDQDYTMWTMGGVPFAGIFRLTDEMRAQGVPPNWMPYVESSNVDDTVARATSLGGRVMHGPADIPGTGRFAVIQDPQGAVFGVYKSVRDSAAWDGTPVVGRMSWHELMTADHVSALAFYSALFGWEQNGEMDMGGGNMYAMYGKGRAMYGGMFSMGPELAGMNPFWLCYIHVPDVGKAVSIATNAGATVQRPQMDIPGGSIAILGDPQGAGFALHHASAATEATPPAATRMKKAARRTASKARKLAKKAVKTVSKNVTKARKLAKKAAKAVSRKMAGKKVKAPSRKKPAARKVAPRKAKTTTKARTKATTKARAKTTARTRTATRARARPKAKSAGRSRRSGRPAKARKR